jgi:type I restriction enzyme M protein
MSNKFEQKTLSGLHDRDINHKNVKQLADILNVDFDDMLAWKKGERTLEDILNLSPSEDATITNFIVPLVRTFLEYKHTEIDIKPKLHINYGRKVVEKGGESDVIIKKGKKPVFVIEAKAYGHPLQTDKEDAEGQAWDYTRANELTPVPWYYMTTNVCETHIYVQKTRKEVLTINEDELDDRLTQLSMLLHRNKISTPTKKKIRGMQSVFRTPVTNEKEFERVLFRCQDYMREAAKPKVGKEAFDEMNKILFIKIFEDRRERNGEENRFSSIKVAAEGENYIKGTLFENIKAYFKKRNTEIFTDEDEIELDNHTVNLIVKKLENKYLVDEGGRVYEPVGSIYENFVSTIFRGENGQYFTPRNVVEFMVKFSDIKWGKDGMKICDPACGSGGFLLTAFAKLDDDLQEEFMEKDKVTFKSPKAEKSYKKCKEKLCNDLLVGYDNANSIAKTAMMNMSVHGDGSVGIYYGNSLIKKQTKPVLAPNEFDIVLTNPPFSVSVKPGSYTDVDGADALKAYTLGHSHTYNKQKKQFEEIKGEKGLRTQDSKILFLERCHEIVESGKMVGIVIDDGVLDNPSAAYVRDWIYDNFVIEAIIALPFGAFSERGADNRTSILFLRKKTDGMIQDKIFMSIPEHVGELFGKLGITQPNDLNKVLEEYRDYTNGKRDGFEYSFITPKNKLEDYYDDDAGTYQNRLDPKYYHPKVKEIMSQIEKSGCAEEISDVIDFIEEKCPKDEVNAFGSKYITKITKDGVIEYDVMDGVNDPKGKMDRVFRAGDLVASRINIKSGMIAIVPDEIDEIHSTSEYYKLVPKEESDKTVLKEYLYIVLRSKPIQTIMDALATGQYLRLKETELGKIKIPVPDVAKQEEIIGEYKAEQEKIDRLKSNYYEKIEKLNEKIEDIIIGEEL